MSACVAVSVYVTVSVLYSCLFLGSPRPDGAVVTTGTSYSNPFKEAHESEPLTRSRVETSAEYLRQIRVVRVGFLDSSLYTQSQPK